MAEPLKNHFGLDVPERLAGQIAQVWPEFHRRGFLRRCRAGYEALELMPRGQQIAAALAEFLPDDYPQAIAVLLQTLGPPLEKTSDNGMAPFFYLPHTMFVAQQGLEHFEESMQAQYELTQRFTAEYCIRPYLVHHTDRTLAQLREWTSAESVHVRRLVSEGTRPRLPWAARLKMFQQDPRPVLPLLETLKDDSELYVRRSVANHLNDIGKDHPDLLCELMDDWRKNASPEREWIIRHALRSLIKQGYAAAFAVLGHGTESAVRLVEVGCEPAAVRVGQTLTARVLLENRSRDIVAAIVDLRVYFRKANGSLSPKTFKLKTVEIPARESLELTKAISFRPMTTRVHYPGTHHMAVLINGQEHTPLPFELLP